MQTEVKPSYKPSLEQGGLYRRYLKRVLDIIFALIILVIASPVMLFCAILIKVEDPSGPIIFKQERIGKRNTIFKVYKFRSMRVVLEKDGCKLSDLERMLKIGGILRKLSVDELPQLINIIKGEMSFIGPRPLPVVYLPYYTDEEIHRHDISPGISGWAQVNGRNQLNWDDRFRYDLEYVRDVNLAFDLKIVAFTIKKVLGRSDIQVRENSTEDRSLHKVRQPNKNFLLHR